jgi:general secretion pathway protein A
MYTNYFGLREKPFNVTPDPRFFYANPVYHEAYATLLAGVQERKGFIVMTGEVGTGKTTLLRMLMANVEAAVRFAYLYNTTLSFEELLAYTCDELGIKVEGESRLRRIQALNAFLIEQLRRGGTGVLLIDEAQNLTTDVLENLRLLSNLETSTEKLLQIVLVGQPELEAKLAQPALRQLKQRVSTQCRLDRLKDREVGSYIRFRLETAGARRSDLFDGGAVDRVAYYAHGIPRLINIVCDNALLLAYGASARAVSTAMVEEVATDLGLTEATTVEAPLAPAPAAGAAVPRPAARRSAGEARALADVMRRRRGRARSGWRGFGWARLGILGAFIAAIAGTLFYASGVTGQIAGMGTSIRSVFETISERASGAWRRSATPGPPGVPAGETNTVDDRRSGPVVPTTKPGEPTLPTAKPGEPTLPTAKPGEPTLPDLPERRPGGPSHTGVGQPGATPSTTGVRGKPRSMVIPSGATIADIALRTYGEYNVLAIDLIKELNPGVEDLNWIKAGARLQLPSLDAATLIRKQSDGTYRFVVASFLSGQAAQTRKERMRRQGYEVNITPRKLSGTLEVHRVEVVGLRTQEAVQQAWDTAVANCWVLLADASCDRKGHG